MPSHQLLRKPLRLFISPSRISSSPQLALPRPRFQSTSNARIDRVLNRLPKFLHPYTNGLRNAPISHVSSFLILHEITAIVPLLSLAGLFHYTSFLPTTGSWFGPGTWLDTKAVGEGVERFGRYFGRKGWFGFEKEKEDGGGDKDITQLNTTEEMGQGVETRRDGAVDLQGEEREIERRWHVGESGSRILVEVATAYAITKVLLPARIVLSVWATPWFARVVLSRVGGLFRRGKKEAQSTAGKATEVAKKS